MSTIVSPSILNADFAFLGDECRSLAAAKSDWIHCDVMDGLFVPNISFGAPVVKCVDNVVDLPLDVHLMINEPIRYIDDFVAAGADIITFHVEATDRVAETIAAIHAKGVKAGLSLKPGTPVSAAAQELEGFTFDADNERNIMNGVASAELVLKLYYTRNSYTLTWETGDYAISDADDAYTHGSVRFGAAIVYPHVAAHGMSVKWDKTLATMPAADTVITAGYSPAVYDVAWNANGGKFEKITWDQAYSEIAEKVKAIIDEKGPQALAMVQDPRPSGSFYTKRFMNALGSPNVYTHGAACNMSKNAGFTQVIGTGDFTSDVANSKMTMFIGRSYADAIKPSQLHAMQKAHENGAELVIVDPRLNNSIAFADEWVPINPGTDLAFILAMAHVVVHNKLYDASYIAENTVGFEEWADYLKDCTPAWAEEITGISKDTIERLATDLATAAPAASIEPSWRGAYGCSYANSGETARAVCCFNTLLGCWNQEGGAFFGNSVKAGDLDKEKFPSVPKPEGKIAGAAEYPLSLAGMGVNVYAAELAKKGEIKGMFFYNSNMVAGYSNPKYLEDCLSNLELSVAIDIQMTETCQACDYVLPDTSYLERLEVPEFIGGKIPAVSLRDQVIEKIHPNTKPVDEIFTELAEACGVGEYFQFTVEELADAQLRTVGLTLDGLRVAGTARFPEKTFKFGKTPTWKTPTGKIQFSSEACHAAGYPSVPQWTEPVASVPEGDNYFRLIGGKQAVHTHTQTANVPALMNISKQYNLDRVWINASRAAKLGIAEGDEVEISNDEAKGTVKVHVTERINPEALYMPSHYGCSSKDEKTAYGFGLRQMDFVPFRIEPGYGGICSQEAIVSVRKVGA